jgi:inhibitor of KinA
VEPPRLVEIPCCYDLELGFDLMAVGTQHGLTAQDVIRIHSSAHYITYFIGFAPGFPYLGGLPEEIFTPRLARPRDKIPARSVGSAAVNVPFIRWSHLGFLDTWTYSTAPL